MKAVCVCVCAFVKFRFQKSKYHDRVPQILKPVKIKSMQVTTLILPTKVFYMQSFKPASYPFYREKIKGVKQTHLGTWSQ